MKHPPLRRGVRRRLTLEAKQLGQIQAFGSNAEVLLQVLRKTRVLRLRRQHQLADRDERKLAVNQVQRALYLEPYPAERFVPCRRCGKLGTTDLDASRKNELLVEVDGQKASVIPHEKQRQSTVRVLAERPDVALCGLADINDRERNAGALETAYARANKLASRRDGIDGPRPPGGIRTGRNVEHVEGGFVDRKIQNVLQPPTQRGLA